ncbi:hypothetical protein G6M89_04985 [Natronolimnobius sp. AArcel1]|uniref:Hvo_1808 family surface protein n=1 Tax=Natronolimnobius sp. AArcel1 TaxID=1679093 RepID=UPI0013EC749C|nr:Hvo_1808 family surface protein [Natronolimnobius sp. AArcel1]NGM68367.1 hypothetical protein [Natronolimnobius sp. AArcel1]
MARVKLAAVVLLVVLAGCSVPGALDEFDDDREPGQIGHYAYDDVFEFDGSEGLTESELEAVKYRAMARIEVIRGLQFDHDVDLEVIDRSEYRTQRGESPAASAVENELWRGLFIIDGETDVNEARDALYGGAVQGYYTSDRIVIVTDDTDEIRINRDTLVHELVHALQDQHFGLERTGETLDAQRAETSLIEGEANYLPYLYAERCDDDWQCLPDPAGPAESELEADDEVEEVDTVDDPADADDAETADELSGQPFNVGLFLSIYAPYSEGPAFVEALHDRDSDWSAVDRAYDDRPASTSQVIHPDRYPDDEPVDVTIPDRSSDDWEPVTVGDELLENETVGEATLFGALWTNGAIDRPLTAGATTLSPYNYSAPATDGWAGDTFQVYHDADNENRTGHVWELAWERPADAEDFADAYRTVLETNDAEQVDDATGETYRIADGDAFAGAYRLAVSGDTVTIVGAPTVDDLEGIHASDSAAPSALAGSHSSPSAAPATAAPSMASPMADG